MGLSGREVQVTGMGCICAAGLDLSHCLKDIFSGQRRQSQPLRFKTSHTTRYPVFEIPDAYVQDDDLKDKNEYTLTVRYALQAAKEAMSQSGWSKSDFKGLKIGVCVGTTVGSTLNSEDFYREYLEEKHPDMTPVHRFLHSNPASALARELGLNGPCQTVVNACSSGTDAIGIGAGWIKSGLCDVVVAGGTDELCRVTYNGFASLMILDASACRPFDRRRQGLNLGEGAGLVVLESASLRHFSEKNNLGRVLGYGTACDAYHLTAPHPQGRGLRQALTQALQLSKTPVSEIAFVNAHGTGTRDNDKVEAMILEDVLPDIPFLSTKGYTGHALGAAGGIEAVFTLACLNLGRIPQSAGFAEADQDMTAMPVQEVTRVRGNAAISQSLAFGGNNAVLILGAGT
ncbi:MAG: beta-ketoacyl-[acyl-carrier-protein] synthase family protein [Desulfonatronovibrio sp.]